MTTTTILPKVMGLQSEPDRRPRFIKPQHLHYYYHCRKFSHLLTSTRLMIIAKEETTHDTQASERWNYVLVVRRHHEAFAELHPCKRHHHVAFVELRPGREAPPRYPRGITS
ncbi:hypothetical protein DEO72_LG9g1758 [Vigna unguiculata]|uniref:Uncharacterized protein n=1 Tax=Vigna unguiculata TaxID=3917 RepID=A0A4D6N1J5_VIGUN|nr:hypothetical protein DEO72_LG9g1758 [Vigna unguiculata]